MNIWLEASISFNFIQNYLILNIIYYVILLLANKMIESFIRFSFLLTYFCLHNVKLVFHHSNIKLLNSFTVFTKYLPSTFSFFWLQGYHSYTKSLDYSSGPWIQGSWGPALLHFWGWRWRNLFAIPEAPKK